MHTINTVYTILIIQYYIEYIHHNDIHFIYICVFKIYMSVSISPFKTPVSSLSGSRSLYPTRCRSNCWATRPRGEWVMHYLVYGKCLVFEYMRGHVTGS